MNDSVDLQKLTRIAITVIALLFAAWMGSIIGSGNYLFVILILIMVGGVIGAATLRTSVWYTILIALGIGGSIPGIPGGFTLLELAFLFSFFSFVILQTVRSIPVRPTYGLADVVLFIILFQLVITYIRHPVGTLLFDSERVGGRPYASIAIACMGYWVLGHVRITPKLAFRLPVFLTCLSIFGALAGLAAYLFPRAQTLAPIHSSFASGGEEGAEIGESRLSFASTLGGNIMRSLCSYYPPLSNLNPLKIMRLGLFVFGFIAIGISGFRTGIISIGFFFLVSQLYWRRYRDFVVTLILGCVTLGGLLLIQSQVSLPYTIQRSLSFLPGNWDPEAVIDAEASIEWRVEMWERMFEDSRYLKNRWLGDGFGFSKDTITVTRGGKETPEALQELYLETGAVHSGPVSTIRYVGYVGLALYLLLTCLVARQAHRLMRKAFRTPFFPAAIFFGASAVVFPFHFIFVFGFYYTSLAQTILSLGMLKMFQGSLDQYLLQQKAKARSEAALPSPEVSPV